jgi:phosphoribosylaminoimidazole-succinocarboxamide synthase
MNSLYQSTIDSLPLLGRGKVRDNYAVGDDQILIVTTDRLSAFDVVMNEPIPGKGMVLNQMTDFWFEKRCAAARSWPSASSRSWWKRSCAVT